MQAGRLTIVFNGEIYNYIEIREELRGLGREFNTASDTEVLLQAWAEWGPGCLARLNGIFAFVSLPPCRTTVTSKWARCSSPFEINSFWTS